MTLITTIVKFDDKSKISYSEAKKKFGEMYNLSSEVTNHETFFADASSSEFTICNSLEDFQLEDEKKYITLSRPELFRLSYKNDDTFRNKIAESIIENNEIGKLEELDTKIAKSMEQASPWVQKNNESYYGEKAIIETKPHKNANSLLQKYANDIGLFNYRYTMEWGN